MTKSISRSALATAILATLSACAAPAYVSPVEVTRFVGQSDAYLAQGTITIEPAPGIAGQSLEYGFYREALRVELEQLGYRVVEQNGAQTASLGYAENVGRPGAQRGPVNVGVGGSTGSYGSGLGVGIGLDLTPRPADEISTFITVAIRASEGGSNLWEGRAAMTATVNSDFAAGDARAARLVDALFADFPGNSGDTVIVE